MNVYLVFTSYLKIIDQCHYYNFMITNHYDYKIFMNNRIISRKQLEMCRIICEPVMFGYYIL